MLTGPQKTVAISAALFVIALVLSQLVRPFSVEFALLWLVISFASLLATVALTLVHFLAAPRAADEA